MAEAESFIHYDEVVELRVDMVRARVVVKADGGSTDFTSVPSSLLCSPVRPEDEILPAVGSLFRS